MVLRCCCLTNKPAALRNKVPGAARKHVPELRQRLQLLTGISVFWRSGCSPEHQNQTQNNTRKHDDVRCLLDAAEPCFAQLGGGAPPAAAAGATRDPTTIECVFGGTVASTLRCPRCGHESSSSAATQNRDHQESESGQ